MATILLPTADAAPLIGLSHRALARAHEVGFFRARTLGPGRRCPRPRWDLADLVALRTAVLLRDEAGVPFPTSLPVLALARDDLAAAAERLIFISYLQPGAPGRRRWVAIIGPEDDAHELLAEGRFTELEPAHLAPAGPFIDAAFAHVVRAERDRRALAARPPNGGTA